MRKRVITRQEMAGAREHGPDWDAPGSSMFDRLRDPARWIPTSVWAPREMFPKLSDEEYETFCAESDAHFAQFLEAARRRA